MKYVLAKEPPARLDRDTLVNPVVVHNREKPKRIAE
jgi:hypothetical protein